MCLFYSPLLQTRGSSADKISAHLERFFFIFIYSTQQTIKCSLTVGHKPDQHVLSFTLRSSTCVMILEPQDVEFYTVIKFYKVKNKSYIKYPFDSLVL